jgi:hypothetical protein
MKAKGADWFRAFFLFTFGVEKEFSECHSPVHENTPIQARFRPFEFATASLFP